MIIGVGLSGGVDSTITAYLLKEAGHEVIGLTMKIWDDSFKSSNKKNACFGPDEKEDLQEIALLCEKLDIPHYVIDLSKEYVTNIIHYFKEEYQAGRTPNPCIKCNQIMKFNFLIERARDLSLPIEKFATGHYADIEYDKSRERFLLKKGLDEKKDQSYFLALLKQGQLAQTIFPLGKYRKEEIKEYSRKLNLKVHEKKESQDFYSGDYDELLEELPPQGKIVNCNGKILGEHKGICYYTVGQRKGLGIGYKEPLYVLAINREKNEVIVGTEKELYKKELVVKELNWIAIKNLEKNMTVRAKIRYLHQEEEALITPIENNQVKVIFTKPQKAVAPGQFAVFYDEDIVIGGGIIDYTINDK